MFIYSFVSGALTVTPVFCAQSHAGLPSGVTKTFCAKDVMLPLPAYPSITPMAVTLAGITISVSFGQMPNASRPIVSVPSGRTIFSTVTS